MGFGKKVDKSPFDNSAQRYSYSMGPSALHVKPANLMSTRAAIFMGFMIMSLCMIGVAEPVVWAGYGAVAAFFIIWEFTFRFIKAKKIAPLLVFVYILLFQGLHIFVPQLLSDTFVFEVLPFALGLVVVTGTDEDSEEEYTRPHPIKECLLPFVYSVPATLCGYFASGLFDRRYVFISVVFAIAFLIGAAWLLTRITKAPYFFTSKRLTEFWDIPVARYEQAKEFFVSKIKFAIVAAGISFIPFFLTSIVMPYVKIHGVPEKMISDSVSVLLVMLVAMIFAFVIPLSGKDQESMFGTRFFAFEVFLASGLLLLPYLAGAARTIQSLIYFYVITVGMDILVTALLAVIRRQQIFVSRSKYLDGLPFMMIMISMVIMIMESCLYQLMAL